MSDITYKNMVRALLKAVPEIDPLFETESKEWGNGSGKNELPPKWWDSEKDGDWNEDLGLYESYPHLVYTDILCEYIRNILETENPDEKLNRIFLFLEQIASHENYDVRNVIEVSVFESLGRDGPEILGRVRKYMGPNTLALCFERKS